MKAEDIARIPVGRKVLIAVTLMTNRPDDDTDYLIEQPGNYVRAEHIIGVAPDPVIKAGDTVKVRLSPHNPDFLSPPRQVICIDGSKAFLKTGVSSIPQYSVMSVSRLVLQD